MLKLLTRIYGEELGRAAQAKIASLLEAFPGRAKQKDHFFSQRDTVLITYGDSLKSEGQAPLMTLHDFAAARLADVFSAVHILPFCPYSSDDGFSVMDYHAVNPEFGNWEHIEAIGRHFELMFDLVINHVSAQSRWFENYRQAREGFTDLAIEVAPGTDLSMVTRPRSLPLLTAVNKADGRQVHVWTTFSADQIDLNFSSPDVLALMVEVLLFYVRQGAGIIRLDAIAYLWKAVGTACIHLPQTYDVVRVFRRVLDAVAPDVILISETNVPHAENISYFGNGRDLAQMVYNFTLPPLLLHTFIKGDAVLLREWVAGLRLDCDTTTYFNFTASHDGIGVRPLEGIVPREEIDNIITRVNKNGGQVSYKRNPDGTDSPYELNISYIDALADPDGESETVLADKFICAQAIQLSLPGVPAIYIHSLLGSRNWTAGVQQTGRARSVNREKLAAADLDAQLARADSFRSRIFFRYCDLIRTRRRQAAFHPNAGLETLDLGPRVLAIKRYCETQRLFAIFNISRDPVTVRLPEADLPAPLTDLVSGLVMAPDAIRLAPYQFAWLS